MPVKYLCTGCKKSVTATKNDRYRTHTHEGERCDMSSEPIPEHVLAQPAKDGDDPSVPKEGLDFAVCPQCDRKVALTRLGFFERHDTTLRGGEQCEVSGVRYKHARRTEDVPLPGDEPKPPSAARPKVSAQQEAVQEGLAEPSLAQKLIASAERHKALEAAKTTSPAPTSESAPADSSPPEPPPTSGVTEPVTPATATASLNGPVEAVAEALVETYEEEGPSGEPILPLSPESTSTPPTSNGSPPAEGSTSSDAPPGEEADATAPEGPWRLGTSFDVRFGQPFSPFSQPGQIPVRLKIGESMSERGKEIAARLRETFYAYTNRNSSDNRSAQRTLGPSEVGSPCDRQIAMKLLGVEPSNPQEGWAPFVGTAVHEELARMFQWANGAQSGRYEVEMRLSFGNPLVPKGTGDLLDRVMMMFLDHKLMGRWSLDKLIQQGPSETYRTQVHVYGYGAELAGEKVKEVAIIGWPRQESSLDKLYVHVEKYDRQIALDALKRVQDIATEVRYRSGEIASNGFVSDRPLEVAQTFPAGDDCKWCPFHLKGDKEMRRGCPGK